MVDVCVQGTIVALLIQILMLHAKVLKPVDPKCDKKVDLAIILDSSASTDWETFQACKELSKNLAKHFSFGRNKSRLSVMTFSFNINIPIQFKDFDKLNNFEKKIDSLTLEGSASYTDRALQVVRFEMFSSKYGSRPRRKDVKRVAVFFTDGRSTYGWEETAYEAKFLKKNGIQVFVVALGKHFFEKEVNAISSKPENVLYFDRDQAPGKPHLLKNLVTAICK